MKADYVKYIEVESLPQSDVQIIHCGYIKVYRKYVHRSIRCAESLANNDTMASHPDDFWGYVSKVVSTYRDNEEFEVFDDLRNDEEVLQACRVAEYSLREYFTMIVNNLSNFCIEGSMGVLGFELQYKGDSSPFRFPRNLANIITPADVQFNTFINEDLQMKRHIKREKLREAIARRRRDEAKKDTDGTVGSMGSD